MKNITITLLGKNELISGEYLYTHLYKSLKLVDKLKKNVNSNYIKKHTKYKLLFYHPLWIAKTLVLADRQPFPPKKIPKMIFVDAISGYRGLLSTVPHTKKLSSPAEQVIAPKIHEREIGKYIKSVQEKQINRSYLLKKPKHQTVDLSLVYLPLWKVYVDSIELKREFIINANTGESEDYMRNFWQESKWMHIG